MDEFLALCDEIRALVRSGVPLGHGLQGAAEELPGQLPAVARQWSQQLEAGQSLAALLRDKTVAAPPFFQALVAAGERSGHLAAALEQFCHTARRAAELRRAVIAALLYPLLVLTLIAVLAIFILQQVGGRPLSLDVMPPASSWYDWNEPLLLGWLAAVPILVLGLFLVWWEQTRQAMSVEPNRFARWTGWVPWMRRLLRDSGMASFAELLALLIEHDVPLPEALPLAGDACGDRQLQQAARRMAEALQRGERTFAQGSAVPAFFRWAMAHSGSRQQLVQMLRSHAAEAHRRADWRAEWMREELPIWLTLGLAGTATAVYVTALVIPWSRLLQEAGQRF